MAAKWALRGALEVNQSEAVSSCHLLFSNQSREEALFLSPLPRVTFSGLAKQHVGPCPLLSQPHVGAPNSTEAGTSQQALSSCANSLGLLVRLPCMGQAVEWKQGLPRGEGM